jgi:AraC-like DNA-binding protein
MVRPGEATIVQHNLAGGLVNEKGTASLSVRLSRAHLRELTGIEDRPALPVIAATQPMLPLLRLYLRGLTQERGELSAEAAALADRQIGELVAAVLSPSSDTARSEGFGGIKAARLQAVRQAVERDLGDASLSAARVGAEFGLSERYVQRLLSDAGTSFSDLVRGKRLERARRLLEAPSSGRRTIADIAYAVGFGDLSTFNHAFRRHFGCTPSEVRRR